jgi:hypothetical protein
VSIVTKRSFSETQPDAANMLPIFLWIFGPIAVVTGLVAIGSGVLAYRTIANEQSAPGKVVEMTRRTSVQRTNEDDSSDRQEEYTQEYFYPVVEFALPNGQQKTAQLNEGNWPPAHEVGEAVTIRYNPTKPMEARIDSVSSTMMFWILPMITGGLSVAFTIAVFGVRYVFKAGK